MFLRKLFIGGFLSLMLFSQTLAFDVPTYEDYVTDLAKVFSAEEELDIENYITEIEKATTVEIGILTVSTTEEYDIFDYTYEVATQWGVGEKENDNGLMIVIAVDDRKWFMATGYGLEGTLPDAIVKRIGERNYPPNFREGNYTQGVMDTLQDIEGYLANDPTVIASYTSNDGYNDIFQDKSTFPTIIIILAFILIPVKSIWVRKKKKKRKERSLLSTGLIFIIAFIAIHFVLGIILAIYSLICDWADGSSGGSSNSWSSGGGWSSGSGWSSGGGSFGGFSGGSFGGGGAGGGW